MKVEELRYATKLAGLVANEYSLAPEFRAIAIGKSKVWARSEFGSILIDTPTTGLSGPCMVNGNALNTILTSLPEKEEINLSLDDSALHWKCKNARGQLALIVLASVLDYLVVTVTDEKYYKLPEDFAQGLSLASSACQASTVSIGIYGITIELNETGLAVDIRSSNGVSLAQSTVVLEGGFPSTESITIRPPVHNILSAILLAGKHGQLAIYSGSLYVRNSGIEAVLPTSAKLSVDLKEICSKYLLETKQVKINATAIKKFLDRANVLIDKYNVTVGIGVKEGNITLTHSGIGGATEESILCEGLSDVTYPTVQLPISLLSVALSGVDIAILDYLSSNVLILKGSSPSFKYIISGK